ncbi:GntR family transcriptional regulator [Actinoplanes sp. NPDC051494]|uniref:GntR family transcriptional regulator n=1 Tax=Actinoplanes sp. NPDC051494 TaxID=3363907 RepID=UPI003793F1E0
MIAFRIDRRSGTAVYAQLGDQVRQAVRTGRLVEGDRLPTAREVAERHGVNPNTVLRAYRDLETAGVVEVRQGAGTFVSAVAPGVDVTALRDEVTGWAARAHAAGIDLPTALALANDALTGAFKETEEMSRHA